MSQQEAPKRYKYLVGRIADTELTWSLAGPDGWVLMGDEEGRATAPVWPHPKYALACATGDWSGLEARSIPLDEWLNIWTPGLAKDQRLIAAFPVPSGQGAVVSPARFKDDIERHLEDYD